LHTQNHDFVIPKSTLGSTTRSISKFNFDFVTSPLDDKHFTFDSPVKSEFKDRENLHLRLKNVIVTQIQKPDLNQQLEYWRTRA
jgi:hypothetical protein